MIHKWNTRNLASESDKQSVAFFNALCTETINALKRYQDYYNEPGFYYGEQQTKTFLTIALGNITNGAVLQEVPADRKIINLEDESKQKSLYKGRLDYWATYKESSFLIELKQSWLRYYGTTDEYSFYKHIEDQLKASIKQIDQLDNKMSFKIKENLFGLGMVVIPVFCRDDDFPKMSIKKNFDFICEEFEKCGANIVSIWDIEKQYKHTQYYTDKNEIDKQNHYPALLFIGKLKKFTRK